MEGKILLLDVYTVDVVIMATLFILESPIFNTLTMTNLI